MDANYSNEPVCTAGVHTQYFSEHPHELIWKLYMSFSEWRYGARARKITPPPPRRHRDKSRPGVGWCDNYNNTDTAHLWRWRRRRLSEKSAERCTALFQMITPNVCERRTLYIHSVWCGAMQHTHSDVTSNKQLSSTGCRSLSRPASRRWICIK